MFAMFKQCFSAITLFFVGLEMLMQGFVHIAGWTKESAAAFEDEASMARKAKMNQMIRENNVAALDEQKAEALRQLPKVA